MSNGERDAILFVSFMFIKHSREAKNILRSSPEVVIAGSHGSHVTNAAASRAPAVRSSSSPGLLQMGGTAVQYCTVTLLSHASNGDAVFILCILISHTAAISQLPFSFSSRKGLAQTQTQTLYSVLRTLDFLPDPWLL